ncbi:cryptochrome/photolyase family protein [Paracoccaceae bacterium GXU_MW_L88]
MSTSPVLLWLRRDLRLADHPALTAAAEAGPVIPVFIAHETTIPVGAASRFRLGLALEAYGEALEAAGSRLILKTGDPAEVLPALAKEVGAAAIHCSRSYDPATKEVDKALKEACEKDGLEITGHEGFLLFEPWTVETGQGEPYKVYSPYRKKVQTRDPGAAIGAPDLTAPESWPESESLKDWALHADMKRGAAVVRPHVEAGEAAAQERLESFLEEDLSDYPTDRDRLDRQGTSHLSAYLTWGEISPRQVWQAAQRAAEEGNSGAGKFIAEIIWREFAWHLLWHFPKLSEDNWRSAWDGFPWKGESEVATGWQRGETGVDVVDAAMRELYVTGYMHNRARMLVGSYLTKNLQTDWRIGRAWFENCLCDHDPANNAMGWQWIAGSGPDAAPYFRIFNPVTQAEEYDPDAKYRDYWLKGEGAAQFEKAIPKSWTITRPDGPPEPVKESRKRALDLYHAFKDE